MNEQAIPKSLEKIIELKEAVKLGKIGKIKKKKKKKKNTNFIELSTGTTRGKPIKAHICS